jgi:hypothetical protein
MCASAMARGIVAKMDKDFANLSACSRASSAVNASSMASCFLARDVASGMTRRGLGRERRWVRGMTTRRDWLGLETRDATTLRRCFDAMIDKNTHAYARSISVLKALTMFCRFNLNAAVTKSLSGVHGSAVKMYVVGVSKPTSFPVLHADLHADEISLMIVEFAHSVSTSPVMPLLDASFFSGASLTTTTAMQY